MIDACFVDAKPHPIIGPPIEGYPSLSIWRGDVEFFNIILLMG
jgi:hypothetical protein